MEKQEKSILGFAVYVKNCFSPKIILKIGTEDRFVIAMICVSI